MVVDKIIIIEFESNVFSLAYSSQAIFPNAYLLQIIYHAKNIYY